MVTYAYSGRDIFWASIVLSLIAQSLGMRLLFQVHCITVSIFLFLQYSLPLPKGGRHSDIPILAPDQRVTYKERRRRANKLDPLGPDYVTNSSPFAMNDVTSRGANLAFAKGGRGGRRRNPNQVRPKGKRK